MEPWQQGEFHAQRAHRFYEAGQWDKALDELRLALTHDPAQSDWHLGMGLTLDALNRFEEAIVCFEQVLKLRGDETDVMLHLAVDLIRLDRCRPAIKVLKRALDIDKDCESAYCQLVLAHAQLGEHDEAETSFYLARQIVDECPLCCDHLAHSFAMRGKLDRAIGCWEQALKLDPRFPDVHGNLAMAHWRRGNPETAHRHYLSQLREDPGDVQTLLRLSDLLMEMGRHAEAAEKLRRALELEPDSAETHVKLGQIALESGHLDAAQSEFQIADQSSSTIAGAHAGLARVALLRGDRALAQSHLRFELDRHGHDPDEVLELGRLLVEARLAQPALSILTPLINAPARHGMEDAGVADALTCRGVAFLMANMPDRGIADLRRALRLNRDHAAALENLAKAYLGRHQPQRARCVLRRLTAVRPPDAHLRQLVVRAAWAHFVERWRRVWRGRSR